MIEKVTLFITRESAGGKELLILEHPFAGYQLPAGTVEEGEAPGEAARREAGEETGLTGLVNWQLVGQVERTLPEDQALLLKPATAFSRPDVNSFDWIRFPRAARVLILQKEKGFTQVKYVEFDRLPEPTGESMIVQGWVPEQLLTNRFRRYFFHAECMADAPARWSIHTDYHRFSLFWADLDNLPALMPPFQEQWEQFGPGRGGR